MTSGSAALRDAILTRGRIEGPLLKVDDFLNHRVDPAGLVFEAVERLDHA